MCRNVCSNGSLASLLRNEVFRLPYSAILGLALQIAQGMNYLHSQRPKIVHRDLKVITASLPTPVPHPMLLSPPIASPAFTALRWLPACLH